MGSWMCTQVVVWNSDARCKPELEVDIEIELGLLDIPGTHFARLLPELEVELEIVDGWSLEAEPVEAVGAIDPLLVEVALTDLEDGWFLGDDEMVAVDDYTIYDEKPHGYSTAYRLAR